jgi:uncharacterized protein YlxW (UPF0749 family)
MHLFFLQLAGDSASGASEGLLASFITGMVTIIVTLIGVFATRNRRQIRSTDDDEEANKTERNDLKMAQEEISDLKSQRNKVQRKLDSALTEIQRLQRLCWENGVNPYPTLSSAPSPGTAPVDDSA